MSLPDVSFERYFICLLRKEASSRITNVLGVHVKIHQRQVWLNLAGQFSPFSPKTHRVAVL